MQRAWLVLVTATIGLGSWGRAGGVVQLENWHQCTAGEGGEHLGESESEDLKHHDYPGRHRVVRDFRCQ
eukprot:762780-Hanusia_phi.AAC.1